MTHIDEPLPTHQHSYPDLPELPTLILHRRRESLFLLFSGIFLGTLAMLNILGITRFIKLFEMDFDASTPGVTVFAVAVGVLPYPITFLCTDFISELYGRRRANLVVLIGLILNVWVIFILWIGGALPGFETLDASGQIIQDAAGRDPVFFEVRTLAFGAVTASMAAYLVAQLVDVQVFHFWKRLTRGKHLWIRNNGSTIASQLVDTVAVILITYSFGALPINDDASIPLQLVVYIATGYVFKLTMALIDTVPFVIGTRYLVRYLRLPPPGTDSE
jgi:uncharacterized integral membrane protein (TIGR00697 family)